MRLRAALRRTGSRVKIAVDEWCNTLEDIEMFVDRGAADVIHVKTPDLGGVNNTIEALLLVRDPGWSPTAVEHATRRTVRRRSARTWPWRARPGRCSPSRGMGVDEGLMIVGNEMARVAAIAAARRPGEMVLP